MKKVYVSLDACYKQLILEQEDYISRKVKESGLTRETIKECMARVITEQLKDNQFIFKTRLIAGADEEIRKSIETRKRMQSSIDISSDSQKLVIYNGVITTSLLAGMSYEVPDKDYDRILWTDDESCDSARLAIKWDDIVRLSAIYCTINANSIISREEVVDVKAEEVCRMIHPKGHADSRFIVELNATLDRIRGLSGRYQVRVDKSEEGIEYKTVYNINDDGIFFLGGAGNEFDENGNARFCKPQYMYLCEKQKRLEYIPRLKGDTLEQCYIMSYLVYRHNLKASKAPAIRIDTMTRQLGIGRMMNDKRELRRYLTLLKPMFKNAKIECDGRKNWKITWEEKK